MFKSLNINIPGRVKKVKTDNFLVALYEAISNSIHAIEDSKKTNGRISIEIIRDPQQPDLVNSELKPITSFFVADNGVGFDKRNMASFEEADSELKSNRGGKGVGRFSLLKFFSEIEVESDFQSEGFFRRVFTFTDAGIDEKSCSELKTAPTDPKTIVKLNKLHSSYEPKTKKTIDDVSIALVEHFITYFATNSMPSISIKDGVANKDLQEFYNNSLGKNASTHVFEIGKYKFHTTGIKNYWGNSKHSIFLCGNKRVADRCSLSVLDDFFAKRFTDVNLQNYAYNIFVESTYLDEIVNDDRDGFRFPEHGTLSSDDQSDIMKAEILQEVLLGAQQDLSTEISKMKEENIKNIQKFVSDIAPQYRQILKDKKDEVSTINETDELKLDLALRKIQFNEEQKTKIEVAHLLKKSDEVGIENVKEWSEKTSEVFSKLSDSGKASLAGYIVQRKVILDLLKKKMQIQGEDFAKEEAIHRLIFPMQSTSDDIEYENQNLWILDERLSYHHYLASDKPLTTIEEAESNSRKEPDIIVFNRPIALNDKTDSEKIDSVAIVEFKRPGESAVKGHKNPVDQIQEYIELIQEGKAKNRKGRTIEANKTTSFFGYVVCEVDANLRKALSRKGMKATPDERGMFGYFEDHRAYIEVISFDKMLDDAYKRNRILFDKLQIPSR